MPPDKNTIRLTTTSVPMTPQMMLASKPASKAFCMNSK